MLQSLPTLSESRLSTLWSVIKTALLVGIFIRFGPFLFSLASVPSSGVQFAASIGYLSRVPEAVEAIREERCRTETEREAFETFAAEVQELHAADDLQPNVHGVDGVAFRNSPVTKGATSESVRVLYRETVMDVDHYEEEYDEPLRTNVSAELGSDFGTALATTTMLLLYGRATRLRGIGKVSKRWLSPNSNRSPRPRHGCGAQRRRSIGYTIGTSLINHSRTSAPRYSGSKRWKESANRSSRVDRPITWMRPKKTS